MARSLITYHDMPCPEADIAAVRGVLRVGRGTKPGRGIADVGPRLLLEGRPAEAVDIDRVLIIEARSLDRTGSLLGEHRSVVRGPWVQISDCLEV
jgi:hypothetical protein